MASSQRTVASGQCRRFMVATAAVSSSRSTASTSRSKVASAIASEPIPQPEVGDPLDPGGGEPLRVPGRDLQPGGLLQARRG